MIEHRIKVDGQRVLLDGYELAVAASEGAAKVVAIGLRYIVDGYPYMEPEEIDLIEAIIDPTRHLRTVADSIGPLTEDGR